MDQQPGLKWWGLRPGCPEKGREAPYALAVRRSCDFVAIVNIARPRNLPSVGTYSLGARNLHPRGVGCMGMRSRRSSLKRGMNQQLRIEMAGDM